MHVLLSTEGTYPYFPGGVSTWADSLVRGLPDIDFTVLALVPHPHVEVRYEVPPNVSLVPVPLWGTERLDEYRRAPRPTVRGRARRDAINRLFLPAFEALLHELLAPRANPEAGGACVQDIADFAIGHDLRRAFRNEATWRLLTARLRDHPLTRGAALADVVELGRSVYRYLTPLAWPVPAADVSHASAAAFCALPAVLAKRSSGVPMVLTEHGVYLRERTMQLSRERVPAARRVLFGNLYELVARVAYDHADLILPVCEYNTRWERQLGVEPDRLRVVYNGVESGHFSAGASGFSFPTIAFVGRIDPLKDLETLFEAVALVRHEFPGVAVRLYGAADDDSYLRRCRDAVRRLGLGDSVRFEGSTGDVAAAYRNCDVVVLSSISEGFPFTLVEAMLSGRPVVATSVGGVPEALGDARLLGRPGDPADLARALSDVLRLSESERREVGQALRRRAEVMFSRDRFLRRYRTVYIELGQSA